MRTVSADIVHRRGPVMFWQAAPMFDELIGSRLQSVDRFAWQSTDGSFRTPSAGSVHMRFESDLDLHLDGASDWTLSCSITDADDQGWMSQYLYDDAGRWVLRDATGEVPFVGCVGEPLMRATPVRDEVNQTVGVSLMFETQEMTLVLWAGEIDTSAR
ncbi:hypothetical protein GCM10011492_14840 [Flexivirga endophytica]|uniref:Uncharacterized protein n=1 Tax=Flexivirga endophytica TaxID=1849103 RepID=A0A916T165_9MICO|nr:hypothetical protein [Flexivirga endophytica]GGB25732.1 hypothetical protein GCM10011492_14840 [Flexivirga endophytica]GHB54329.1 hypothetical protein GCM10008112_24160 [Flexivirga endophytica]